MPGTHDPGSRRTGKTKAPRPTTGLRQFVDIERQHDWMEGRTELPDAEERSESLELRFKYLPRLEKLLARPQAKVVLELLRRYCQACIPMPRRTERYYWSASCLPSTSDKPLVRINASWMELFTLYADGDGIRARFILHRSDFTTDHGAIDEALIEGCVAAPEDVTYFLPRGEDMFGINVRGSASTEEALANAHMLRAIRRFNLTHMNRGRNAYQASHCYSLADRMLDG